MVIIEQFDEFWSCGMIMTWFGDNMSVDLSFWLYGIGSVPCGLLNGNGYMV